MESGRVIRKQHRTHNESIELHDIRFSMSSLLNIYNVEKMMICTM